METSGNVGLIIMLSTAGLPYFRVASLTRIGYGMKFIII